MSVLAVDSELKHDVVVVGGGPAGVCAAIASARGGADTVLIEQHGFLGGMATLAMFQPWRGFHSLGKQIVEGIGNEIVQELVSRGGSLGHLVDPTGVSFTVTPFDAEMLKDVLQMMLERDHVKVLFHSQFAKAETAGKIINSILVRRKEGNVSLSANTYIDATGNGRVAVNAGAEHIKHESNASYPFSMKKVNERALIDFAQNNPHEFSGTTSAIRNGFLSLKGFSSLTKKWLEESPMLARSDSLQIDGTMRNGEVIVSMISLPNVNATDEGSLTRAGMRCRQLAPKAALFLANNCPGFVDSQIHATPQQIGFHATIQVCGTITISDSDVMSGKTFDDSIATCAMPGRPGSTFQVPRRALFTPDVKNLLVTGRAILPPTSLFATNSQAASMQLGDAAGRIASEIKATLQNKN